MQTNAKLPGKKFCMLLKQAIFEGLLIHFFAKKKILTLSSQTVSGLIAIIH